MNKIKIKLKKAPTESKAYGGQHNYALDLSSSKSTKFNDNPFSISNTLNPVDEEEANIEAEHGEVIHGDFDMDGMSETMRVGGKKHYAGGTPLTVPDGSFVFSDSKKLNISGDSLVEFGKSEDTKKKFTPAALAKQYNINSYKAIIDDKDADPISKRTAELMVSNYETKLAKLALVQESKKGFPNGIPEIAMPYLMMQQEVEVQSQPAQTAFKHGGQYKFDDGGSPSLRFNNLFKFDKEGNPIIPYGVSKTPEGGITPTGQPNSYNRGKEYLQKWESLIPGVSNLDNQTAQALIYDYSLKHNPEAIRTMWKTYGNTNKGRSIASTKKLGINGKFSDTDLTDENMFALKDAYVDGYFGVRQLDPMAPATKPQPTTIGPPPKTEPKATVTQEETESNPFEPSQAQKSQSRYWTQDKINVASAFQNRNNLKKYIPWEAPINGVTADPTFYDPNRELAQNSEMMNTEMMYNSQFAGPQAASVRNSAVSAQAGANAANTMAKYDNLNVTVANQFAGVNAEMTNAVMAGNTVRMNNLYKGNVIANQQFDNSRAQASDVIRKNLLSGLDNKQKAEWINMWYPQYNIDPRDGSIDYTKGHSSITPGSSGKSQSLIEIFNQLKKDNPGTPDDILKEQAKQMLGLAKNTIDSDGDSRSTYQGQIPPLLNNLHQR